MKWYMVLCIGVVIGGVSFANTGGMRWSHPLPVLSDSPPQPAVAPEVRFQDVEVIAQAGRLIAWRVFAKRAAFSEAEQQVVVHQVEAKIFRGDDTLRVTASRGLIDRATGNLTVRGHVQFQPRQGYVIETQALQWRAADRLLFTDAPVEMRGPSVSVTGVGLQSQVDQHRMTLQRQVRASFRLSHPR